MANSHVKKVKNTFHLDSLFNKMKEEDMPAALHKSSRRTSVRTKLNKENLFTTNKNISTSSSSGSTKATAKTNCPNMSVSNSSSLKTAALFKPTTEALMSDFRLFLQPLSTNRDGSQKAEDEAQSLTDQFEDFKSYYVKKMTDFGFNGFNYATHMATHKRTSGGAAVVSNRGGYTSSEEAFISHSEPNLARPSSYDLIKRNRYEYIDDLVMNKMYKSIGIEAAIVKVARAKERDHRRADLESIRLRKRGVATHAPNTETTTKKKVNAGETTRDEDNFSAYCHDLTEDFLRGKNQTKLKSQSKFFSPSLIICK